jgi:hypothetical protein
LIFTSKRSFRYPTKFLVTCLFPVRSEHFPKHRVSNTCYSSFSLTARAISVTISVSFLIRICRVVLWKLGSHYEIDIGQHGECIQSMLKGKQLVDWSLKLTCILFKYSFPTPKKTHHVSITKTKPTN